MVRTQLSIFLQNKPGVMATVCRTLQDAGINIEGLCVSDTVDHAVVRMVPDDAHKAIHVLGDHGALVVETEVLALDLPNRPGSLGEVAEKLARAKVNIEYAYASAMGQKSVAFLRVSNTKKALKVLATKKRKS